MAVQPHNIWSFIDETMLQHLQDSFAAQQHLSIALFSRDASPLCRPATYRHMSGEAGRLLQPFLHFILSNPPHFAGLGLQDGNTIFASFFGGAIHRAIVPILVNRQMVGAAQLLACKKMDKFDLQRWQYILDGFAWNEVSYLAFLDSQPHVPMADLMQNSALLQAQLSDLIEFAQSSPAKKSSAEGETLQPAASQAELLCNSQGDILNASDAMVQVLRYENVSEIVGLNVVTHLVIRAADQVALQKEMRHPRGAFSKSAHVQTKDGYLLEINWRILPEKDTDGQDVGWRWGVKDVKPVYESGKPASVTTESLPLEKLEENGSDYERVRAAIGERDETRTEAPAGVDSELTEEEVPGQGVIREVLPEEEFLEQGVIREVSPEELSFLDNLKLPLFAIDPDGRILLWNRLLEQQLHIPAAAVVGTSFGNLLVDDSLKIWQQWLFDFRIDRDAVEFKSATLLHLLDNSGDAFALRLELAKSTVMDQLIISAIVASCEKTTLPLRLRSRSIEPSFPEAPASPTLGPTEPEVRDVLAELIERVENEWGALYAALQRLGGERSLAPASRELTTATLRSGERFSRLLQEMHYGCGRIQLNKSAVNLARLIRHATNTQVTLFEQPLSVQWHIADEGLMAHADLVVTFHAMIYLLDYIRRSVTVETPLRVQIKSAPWPDAAEKVEQKNPAVLLEICYEDPGVALPQPQKWTWPHHKEGDLALAAVHAIAAAQGCEIKVPPGPKGKNCIRMFWPAAPAAKTRHKKSTTVLVIEDEPGIVQMNTLMLEHAGYKVLAALTGTEGLKLLQLHQEEIGTVLLDWQLPDMTCEETAEKIHAISPIPIIFSSGYIPDTDMKRILDKYHAQFLQKPYTLATLAKTVDKTMRNQA